MTSYYTAMIGSNRARLVVLEILTYANGLVWGNTLSRDEFIVASSRAQVTSKVAMLDSLMMSEPKWNPRKRVKRLVYYGSWWGYGPACIDENFIGRFELIDCVDIDAKAINTSKQICLGENFDFHLQDAMEFSEQDSDDTPTLVVNTSLEHFTKEQLIEWFDKVGSNSATSGIYVQATDMDADDHVWTPTGGEFQEFLSELPGAYEIEFFDPIPLVNKWSRYSALLQRSTETT